MIKEKKRITKYNRKKTKQQIIQEYLRTIAVSFFIGVVITSFLAIHARNEMIKNIYANIEEQESMDKKMAQQIIQQSDLMDDLHKKKYLVCLHVGDLYATAGDYKNAQYAYELAIDKVPAGVYKPYLKLCSVLIAQEKMDKANALLDSLKDHKNKSLIKVKSRSYIIMGDKYYSIGKFLSAAKSYEKAEFYYSKFTRKDPKIEEAIKKRVINAYIQTADVMVKTGLNSDAVRFLQKAEKYDPKNFQIRYKLAIVLSDSDPEASITYLDKLLDEIPQHIDYGVYCNALRKAANIADLDGRPTQAKYYRYKMHSIDMFVNRKVVYKNDFDISLDAFSVRKAWFTYPLRGTFSITNNSSVDIVNMYADFVLVNGDKPVETITQHFVNRDNPLYSNGYESVSTSVKFKKRIFTKKELENYSIEVYLYKDEKFKTQVAKFKIPSKSFNNISK